MKRKAIWRPVLAATLSAVCVLRAEAGTAFLRDAEQEARAVELASIVGELRGMPGLSAKVSSTQERHALVIGIDDYESLTDLNKAVGDSRTIAEALTGLGFTVSRLENLGIDDFDGALDAFYDQLSEGDIAFVFFAGHGVALDGVNFLLPTDMPALRSIKSSRLERYAVDAGRIVDEIKARGVELAFVVLDACRNNPFPEEDMRGGAALGGLQRMNPKEGAFVIYSAGIGQTALDRLGADDPEPNSVFTRKFWQILKTPGLPVVDIAKRTQVEVSALAATVEHEQAPAYYDQIVGQFYFQPPKPKLFGLAIGIDDYGDERFNLNGAVNDAELIAAALESAGAERVERVLNDDARLRFIEYAWEDILGEAQPGDSIVLSFSGNAAQVPDTSPVPEKDGLREFLILSGRESLSGLVKDGTVSDPDRVITDARLTQWMSAAADRNVNVVLLTDGCHGGGMLDREFANVSFIGASQENEVATERRFEGKSYGLASFVFANAISGAADFNEDGFVSQRELFAYISENVPRMALRQNPQLLPAMTESGAGLALLETKEDGRDRVVDLKPYWSKVQAPVPAAQQEAPAGSSGTR